MILNWIKTIDEKPPNGEAVVGYFPENNTIVLCVLDRGIWDYYDNTSDGWQSIFSNQNPSHWMSLSEIPKPSPKKKDVNISLKRNFQNIDLN